MELPAARQPDFYLRPATLEVEAERDEGQALLTDLAPQPGDLLLMKEELSVPLGVVIGVRPVAIGTDVAAEEPALVVAD